MTVPRARLPLRVKYDQAIVDKIGGSAAQVLGGRAWLWDDAKLFLSGEIFHDFTGSDPTSTERWVMYNAGKRGAEVRPSDLSLRTHPGNRGCMSQNGAIWLAANGYHHLSILRFFYGEDIEVRTLDLPLEKPNTSSAFSNPLGALVLAAFGLILQTYVEELPPEERFASTLRVLQLATGFPLDEAGTLKAPRISQSGNLWVYSYASAKEDAKAQIDQHEWALPALAAAHLGPALTGQAQVPVEAPKKGDGLGLALLAAGVVWVVG